MRRAQSGHPQRDSPGGGCTCHMSVARSRVSGSGLPQVSPCKISPRKEPWGELTGLITWSMMTRAQSGPPLRIPQEGIATTRPRPEAGSPAAGCPRAGSAAPDSQSAPALASSLAAHCSAQRMHVSDTATHGLCGLESCSDLSVS